MSEHDLRGPLVERDAEQRLQFPIRLGEVLIETPTDRARHFFIIGLAPDLPPLMPSANPPPCRTRPHCLYDPVESQPSEEVLHVG